MTVTEKFGHRKLCAGCGLATSTSVLVVLATDGIRVIGTEWSRLGLGPIGPRELGLTQPVAVVLDGDEVGVVDDAVDQSGWCWWRSERWTTRPRRRVCGDGESLLRGPSPSGSGAQRGVLSIARSPLARDRRRDGCRGTPRRAREWTMGPVADVAVLPTGTCATYTLVAESVSVAVTLARGP
jgi:hypothetical protein